MMEKKILEIIKKQPPLFYPKDIVFEITAHVRENYYEKDFTKWMFEKEYFYGELSEKYFSSITEMKFDSLEAVYEHWKENIKTQ